MKVLTWNSAMRFRDKIEEVLPLQPDLMIIPECEAPEKWNNQPRLQSLNQFLWYGENKNKGLGIISLNQNLRLQLHSFIMMHFGLSYQLLLLERKNSFSLLYGLKMRQRNSIVT
jgi:hypothetical protein